jgi:bacterioferritin (cytochrome b1)
LKELLNAAIAREMQVSIQYIWQHVQVIGVKGIAVKDQFKPTAIAEMKHAESIDERLWYLGGTPTTRLLSSPPRKEISPRHSCSRRSWKTKRSITISLPRCSKRSEP